MPSMHDGDTTELVAKGIALHDAGNLIVALSHLEKAMQTCPTPLARSYFGVCIAAERGQVSRGIALCNGAIAEAPGDPVHYLNLARIQFRAGRKSDALATLRRGRAAGELPAMQALLDQPGNRRPPLFSSLLRSHPLNRYLGLLLGRLGLR